MNKEYSEFQKRIKHKLLDIDKSVDWLCKEVSDKTGMYFDTSVLSKIYRGKNNNERFINAIKEILELE